jgi:hypothetical protein
MWVVMVTAVVSAIDYYRRFQSQLNARVTDVNVARERRASYQADPGAARPATSVIRYFRIAT